MVARSAEVTSVERGFREEHLELPPAEAFGEDMDEDPPESLDCGAGEPAGRGRRGGEEREREREREGWGAGSRNV